MPVKSYPKCLVLRGERLRGLLPLVVVLFFLGKGLAWGHGVEGEIHKLPGVLVVEAAYDTGEPMSYARVEIWSPDSKIRFQLGRTDRNGKFAFVPDVTGLWKVKVSDGLGHALALEVRVDSQVLEGASSVETHSPTPPSQGVLTYLWEARRFKIFWGLLIIWGLFSGLREILRLRHKKN